MTELSIIIPVLNEAGRLGDCLARLYSQPGVTDDVEVIVVDGGSSDSSRAEAAGYPCILLQSPAGRATQMNAGAELASADSLLFLHADSRLANDFAPGQLDGADWGFFAIALSGGKPAFRVIETMINLRTRLTRIAGGDQGLFFRRDFFFAVGGFPAIPLMEDIAICKAARGHGAPRIIDAAITTSSRRWQHHGIVKTILLMWWMRFAYWLGVDPARLHRLYYSR